MTLGQSEAAAPAALGVFFLFASYLNLNDPDWLLWSTAYALGAAICVWTALRGWTVGTDGMGKVVSTAPRWVAITYGAACVGLAWHSAFLAPRAEDERSAADGAILAFLSSEVCREAGGALIMALSMALCASMGRPLSGRNSLPGSTAGGTVVNVVSVVVAVAAIFLGIFLPGYLRRAGIAVPAHCGGGD